MVESREANSYISELNPAIQKLAARAHRVFLQYGCSSYVKTIYIGYDLDGEMVGAMYGHPRYLEVALALPEDAEGSLLADASHLTWKTLPVAAIVRDVDSDMLEFEELVGRACGRVRNREHDVNRDNEFFYRARREHEPDNRYGRIKRT